MPEPEKWLLHEWLRHTAERSPHAPAVVEDGRITSFEDLRRQAVSLAAFLIESGVSKGDRVGLILSKTTDAVISVFGSLLAGAVYVPIHPRWPKDRVAAVLKDSSPQIAIEDFAGAPRICDCDGTTLVPWARAVGRSDICQMPAIAPTDPAFILFTSGSTGHPKGVVISHRAVGVFVRWTADQFGVCAEDRIVCPAPLGFDLSTFDLFNMALRGAACLLVPEGSVLMPRHLNRFLRDERVTCWYSVPSLLTLMLREGFAENSYRDLRLVLFAGEVFPGPALARLQAALPHATCANLYGPTETNVVTWHETSKGFDPSGPPPIGRACPYAELHVDAESGELLAGGDSLMEGYWSRREETARVFLILGDKRYYRTGDRVTVDAAGNYVFIGRLDRQVKRRGYRIELGEIEVVLARHEGIAEAAAVAHQGPDDGTLITAFVRLRSEPRTPIIDIKTHCAGLLPIYMLPDRVVRVAELPKNNRGKTDYRALERQAAKEHLYGYTK
ncbi:MAG: amino acid adenylation domain-containing protein [Chloroflexi bacterium]|nr:amino acid adenylation domain-containing protein [Chloroflexota bacterium]